MNLRMGSELTRTTAVTQLDMEHQTTNLGVRSSNLFGRAST